MDQRENNRRNKKKPGGRKSWKYQFNLKFRQRTQDEKRINDETLRRAEFYTYPMGTERRVDSLERRLHLNECEDFYKNQEFRNEIVNLEDLIKEPVYTCIIGPPASGKTIFTKMLAKEAVSKNYQTWLLNCEDYKEKDEISLVDLLFHRYKEYKTKGIYDPNYQDRKRIGEDKDFRLIIIDNLDKANFKLSDKAVSSSIVNFDHTTKLPPSVLFSLLCSKHLLPNFGLIISSRPHSIAQLPPKLRPKKVFFRNGLHGEGLLGEGLLGEEIAELFEILQSTPLLSGFIDLARISPLFLYTFKEMKMDKNTSGVKLIIETIQYFRKSMHYVTEAEKQIELKVEKIIAKISYEKAEQKSEEIKGNELNTIEEHHLQARDVQNWLYPTIESPGGCFHARDEMLVYHYNGKLMQEFLAMTHLMEYSTKEEFKKLIENQFPSVSVDKSKKAQVEEDKLANLRRTTCKWISYLPIDQEKLKEFFNIFAKKLEEATSDKNNINDERHLKTLISDVMLIDDDEMFQQFREILKTLDFRLPNALEENDKKNLVGFLKKMVKKMKHFSLNCKNFDVAEVKEILRIIISTEGKIEYLSLDNVCKLEPETNGTICDELLPKITKEFKLTLIDKIGFRDLKTMLEEVDDARLDKNLRLELSSPEDTQQNLAAQNWKRTINQNRENTGKQPESIVKTIMDKQREEANTKLKELCGEEFSTEKSSVVQPKVKYIEDFHSTQIFKDLSYNTNTYDAEPYANASDVPDVVEEFLYGKEDDGKDFTKRHQHPETRESAVLIGAKGSGKSIIANRMVLESNSSDQYSVVINMEDFREEDTICLKEVLIDKLADKYGVYKKQECDVFNEVLKRKVNIILDNYDRASFKLTTSSSPDVNEKMKPKELFGNLFAKRLLPEANILLISRPYAITQLPSELRPKSLFFVGYLSDEDVKILFNRFCGKKSEEKRKHINQHFPLAWKLCRNPQMLYILARNVKLEKMRNFFELIDEICFQFNGDDQESRENYHVMNSNKLKYLAYVASKDSSITLITDAASKNIEAVEGMMLVKPYGNNQQTNKSQIQSHFINPLIQDHYTARYLKEGPPEEELKKFVDEKLFPLSAEKDGNSERFSLIRRFCCSNIEGRTEMSKYFWDKMKEALTKPIEVVEDGNLILDLVEIFNEYKRTKGQECYVQNLCEELKRTGLVFHNLIFTDSDQSQAFCEVTKLCPYDVSDVKTVKICGENLNSEEFKQICGTMGKKEKLKISKLEVEKIGDFEISTMLAVKSFFPFTEDEVMIDIHDPGTAHDLNDELVGVVKKLNKKLKKDLVITIQDGAEGRYPHKKVK